MRAAIRLMQQNRWSRAFFTAFTVWGLFAVFFAAVDALRSDMDSARRWLLLGALSLGVAGGILGSYFYLAHRQEAQR